MRLPLVSPLDSRDGTSTKDGRNTNVLVEDDNGTPIAAVRPGLVTDATSSGAGKGAVAFNGDLITIYGSTLYHGTTPSSVGSVTGDFFDFCQSPL